MEVLVELFKEDTFLECPTGGLLDHIHVPSLGDNLIFDDARIADEGVDAIGDHHRHGIAVVDGRSRMFLSLFAGSE